MPPVIPFPSEHQRPSLRRLVAEEIRISHNRLVRVGPETATALCGFLAGVALGLDYASDTDAAACCRRAAQALESDWWSYNAVVSDLYLSLAE